ncbi:MAG: hypothetical protein CL799_07205 [Chromatiales bacterium]|jgi:hypothetical protein|nr:hypothetical protein [Chromatiales bacterium]
MAGNISPVVTIITIVIIAVNTDTAGQNSFIAPLCCIDTNPFDCRESTTAPGRKRAMLMLVMMPGDRHRSMNDREPD